MDISMDYRFAEVCEKFMPRLEALFAGQDYQIMETPNYISTMSLALFSRCWGFIPTWNATPLMDEWTCLCKPRISYISLSLRLTSLQMRLCHKSRKSNTPNRLSTTSENFIKSVSTFQVLQSGLRVGKWFLNTKKTAALKRERLFHFQQVKRLFAFFGFLLLLKVFLQASEDFEVAEGAVLNVVIDFLHSTLGLLGCLFGGLFLCALG